MDLETSAFEDESKLANFVLENRRSSGSSNGFNFSFNPRKNLKDSFDREVSHLSNDHIVSHSAHVIVASGYDFGSRSPKKKETSRPPLHRDHSSRRQLQTRGVLSRDNKLTVYLRIRPPPQSRPGDAETNNTIEILDAFNEPGHFPRLIRTYPPPISNAYRRNINRQVRDTSSHAREFDFDGVMGPKTSQKTVYATVAAPMIQELLHSTFHHMPTSLSSSATSTNQSALLFSYGITNAGKTHTILGDLKSRNQSNWGIIPRAINEVLENMKVLEPNPSSSLSSESQEQRQQQQKSGAQLRVSYFEIYNEQVYDLMPSKKASSKTAFGQVPPLKVREYRGETIVQGLARHKIESVEQGIEITKLAHQRRHTSSNNINSDSSRSHFVCQMQVIQASDGSVAMVSNDDDDASTFLSIGSFSTDEEKTTQDKLVTSTIWIVDLAGSERSKRTQVGSKRQKESTQINKSLMTLMRCLTSIQDHDRHGKPSAVVPYRESKLTHVFMSHLSSSSAPRTAMMLNVNPAIEDFDETQHVLAYASKAKLIKLDPNEYNKKRRQYFGECYDQHGRKKVKPASQDAYPPKSSPSEKKDTMFSRMAKKFSPKRVFQRVTTPSKPLSSTTRSIPSSNQDQLDETRTSLTEARARVETLELQNMALHEELENKEEQIRSEVAVEMEEHLRETRRKHQEKYKKLQAQLERETSTTAFNVKMDRAEIQLEELMDKVDECEKEMVRMNQDHVREVDAMQSEISSLSTELKKALTEKNEEQAKVEYLQKELECFKKKVHKLNKTRTPHSQSKKVILENEESEVENLLPAPAAEEGQSMEPLKFKLSVTKKVYRNKLRPRKPLSASTNKV